MNYWLISDTHFGHTKLDEWNKRTGDWQERLWKGLAAIPDGSDEDTLIHLGDICMGDDLEVHLKLQSTLPAGVRRVLVRGNHDKKSYAWYYAHGWDFVCDGFNLLFQGHYLKFSHRPSPPDQDNSTFNIHGHTHGGIHHSEDYVTWYNNDYHVDISPELVGYVPLKLDTLLKTL